MALKEKEMTDLEKWGQKARANAVKKEAPPRSEEEMIQNMMKLYPWISRRSAKDDIARWS